MKRFTGTEKWQKQWYLELTLGQKCLWGYLCENCDPAGVWEPNWKLASYLIGEAFTAESLAAFGGRARLLAGGGVWVVDFCQFQYGQLSRACRAHNHIFRALEKHGLLALVESRLAGVPRPAASDTLPPTLSDTLCHRDKDKDKEEETEKDKDPEGEGTGGRAEVAAAAVVVATEREAQGRRLGAIMRRPPGERWSARETSAAALLGPLAGDDLAAVERYYAATILGGGDIRRRDLLALLDHWPGELDRARAHGRKAEGGRRNAEGPEGAGSLPAGFAEWKAQAPEYASTAWAGWAAVPGFAREEYRRWKGK